MVLDTARADAFEPYGAPAGASPAVGQLARRGTAHTRAFSTGCWTVPAHGSLLAGALPRTMGLQHRGGQTPAGFQAALRANRARLLPEWLRTRGYETAGVSTNAWVSPQSGFDTGFDRFRYVASPRNPHLTPRNRRDRVAFVLEAFRAHVDDGAAAVEAEIARWVADADRRPFFWFVNLNECHSPYLPPEPFNPLSGLGRVRAAVEASRHLTLGAIWRCCVGGFDVPDEALERMRALYAGAIRLVDAWLARLLDRLDHHGLLDDTQVLVLSDHGENLGDNGLLAHAFSLDDRLIRVPFVTAGPIAPPAADTVLSLSDVARWLGDAMGGGDHPWAGRPPAGVAVAQLDAPGEGNEDRVAAAVAEWGLGDEAISRMCDSFVAATDGTTKLVRHADGSEDVYDLPSDPLESRPRRADADRDARLAPLRAAIDAAAGAERPRTPEPTTATEDEALAEQMRLLGYL